MQKSAAYKISCWYKTAVFSLSRTFAFGTCNLSPRCWQTNQNLTCRGGWPVSRGPEMKAKNLTAAACNLSTERWQTNTV